MNWVLALFFLPGLMVGITVHEFAHAISAKWLGDRNPERMGRISLNPFRHLSGLGTLAVLFIGFGWGKPVEVNPFNFKRPKRDDLLCSLAGPAANILVVFISLGLLYLLRAVQQQWFVNGPKLLAVVVMVIAAFFYSLIFLNFILAVINMIPIPPLDGSKIWPCIIPGMRLSFSNKWNVIWIIVLLVLIYSNAIGKIIRPLSKYGMRFLPKITDFYVQPKRPDDFPTVLCPPNDARYITYDHDDVTEPNYYELYYTVTLDRSDEIIQALHARFQEEGYRPIDYDPADPNALIGPFWQKDESEPDYTWYYWQEYWAKESDALLDVYLDYDIEPNEVSNDVDLDIYLSLYLKDSDLLESFRRAESERASAFPEKENSSE